MNKDELILDRVRSLTAHDLSTGSLLYRLTSIEDPSLNCTSDSEQVTDAIGSVITVLNRAKKAQFTGSNSLVSLNLLAAQYGTDKEVATETKKIVVPTYEVITIPDSATTITLAQTPVTGSVKYIYSISDNDIGTGYSAAAIKSATEFVIDEATKTITLPEGLTGKVFVEYSYETKEANKISNMASKFPEACSLVIYAYFKDKCNENIVYSGRIVANKAKINAESLELALTSTGKHAFTYDILKDYCTEDGEDELFSIIIAQ